MRIFMVLIIGLFFGTGAGFLLGVSSDVEMTGHDHALHDHSKMIDQPASSDAPSVTIALIPDSMSGWNLHIMPKNFRFTPDAVNQADVAGEGHAHVYVNGQKLMRVYSEWTHIPSLPTGTVDLSVNLNANSHSPISVGGVPVAANTIVEVK